MEQSEKSIEALYQGSENINEMRKRIKRVTNMLASCIRYQEYQQWQARPPWKRCMKLCAPQNFPWILKWSTESEKISFCYSYNDEERFLDEDQGQYIIDTDAEIRLVHVLKTYRALPLLLEFVNEMFPVSIKSLQHFFDAAEAFKGES